MDKLLRTYSQIKTNIQRFSVLTRTFRFRIQIILITSLSIHSSNPPWRPNISATNDGADDGAVDGIDANADVDAAI